MMAYDNSKLYNITPGAHQKNHGWKKFFLVDKFHN
jgi:hypothetical protein